jgi:hypothetical protein
MLARMNFAATIAANQRTNLVRELAGSAGSPASVLDSVLERLSPAPFDQRARSELLTYLEVGGSWTGSDAQLRTKVPGLVRLIVGSGEYQVV